MTAPLTPAACDLRGMPFMPLDVVRLLDSDLFALSTGDEFKAAIALWCKAWNQVPAASLPCDDRILARLAGVSLREWSGVKGVALRGWQLADDGRLYHPVVAEKALEAWAARERQRERARKRWDKPRDGAPEEPPQGAVEHAPADASAHATASPVAMQGTGTGTERERSDDLSLVTEVTKDSLEKLFEQAWQAFPHAKGRRSRAPALQRFLTLPADVRTQLPAAVRAFAVHEKTLRSRPNYTGAASMDRWLERGLHEEWLGGSPTTAPPAATFGGPLDLRSAIIAAEDESFAVTYLDPCHWQADPPVLFAKTGIAADRLRQRCGPILGRFGVNVQQQVRT